MKSTFAAVTVACVAQFLLAAPVFAAHTLHPSITRSATMIESQDISTARSQSELTGDQIFQFAVSQWQTHLVPTFVSFQVPCIQTFLDYRCHSNDDVQFVTRMGDGRTSAYAISPGGLAPQRIAQGELITGPGGAPLGFYRHLGSLTVIPYQYGDDTDTGPTDILPEKTIASVLSIGHYYNITVAGKEEAGGRWCYHLLLKAVDNPDRFPLKELWVDTATFDIIGLTYNWKFGEYEHRGTVHYRFAEIYPTNTWTITHIDARVVTHRLFSGKPRVESTSGDLSNVSFPVNEPSGDFVPAPDPTPNPFTSF